ncbi:MAG: hypothetical protein MJ188_09320 [Treponema sp.]|nr:hypothetical protein [Treponema sp.]
MNKNFRIVIVLLILNALFVSSVFAKSKKKEETKAPIWVTDEGRNKLFPKSEYLTASAFGSSDTDAKSKAAAEINGTIKSIIESNVSSEYSAVESDGSLISRKSISQNVDISSGNTLFQLEYTVPFYSPDYGMYVCVAYINREKAFNAVLPKLNKAQQIFPAAYKKALLIEDEFEKILAIQKAQEFLTEYYEVYDFALAVAPSKTQKYSDVDTLAAASIAKVYELKSQIAIYVQVEADKNNQILDKITESFTKNNFIVVKSGAYDYKAKVIVNTELTKTQETYQTYPFISVEVLAGANTKYSYSKQLDKVAGFDEATAIRRSYMNMCKAIEEDFLK